MVRLMQDFYLMDNARNLTPMPLSHGERGAYPPPSSLYRNYCGMPLRGDNNAKVDKKLKKTVYSQAGHVS
jgi:hypothetical protein